MCQPGPETVNAYVNEKVMEDGIIYVSCELSRDSAIWREAELHEGKI